jgi:hypothetical protein
MTGSVLSEARTNNLVAFLGRVVRNGWWTAVRWLLNWPRIG